MKTSNKKQIIKILGVAAAAIVIGLSQLGVFPDLGVSKAILKAVGFDAPVVAAPEAAK
jgi:hypothetical protein